VSDATRPLRTVEAIHAIDDRDLDGAWKAALLLQAEHAGRGSDGFRHVFLATDSGHLDGSGLMLLRIAAALQELDVEVTAVLPQPSPMLVVATREGIPVIALPARSRLAWMYALRWWDRARPPGLLWCNGLAPAVATAGAPDRLVHLHRRPSGMRALLARLARRDAVTTLVPSISMLEAVPGALVLPNWTDRIRRAAPSADEDRRIRIGFWGRLGLDEGVQVLAGALEMLDTCMPGHYRLVLAGEPVCVPEEDLAELEEALGPVAHLTHRAGWVDPAAFFDTIDLLVVPSIVEEAFGLVAAEAMAARMPVIVSDAGALPEVVGPEGEIVPAGDSVALAERIAELTVGSAAAHGRALFERWFAEYSPAAGTARMRTLVDALDVRRAESGAARAAGIAGPAL